MPKRFSQTRAQLSAEVEELARDRYAQQCRADGLELRLESERLLRRAAEAASTQALRAQRIAEERLLALLDRFLDRDRPTMLMGRVAFAEGRDAEAPRG